MSLDPFWSRDGLTIYCGDCADVLPLLPKSDLLCTDPPYGIGINKSGRLSVSRGRGGERWDDAPPTQKLLAAAVGSANDAVVWGGNYFGLPPCRGFMVWDKQNDGRDFGDCEYAWTTLDAVPRIYRDRPQNMDEGRFHTTQKPVGLMKWCLMAFGGIATVIDPFMGSGSTLIAARDLGINAVGVEVSEHYCNVAVRRLSQMVLPLTREAHDVGQ